MRHRSHIPSLVLALAAIFAIAACGGGGGGTTDDASTPAVSDTEAAGTTGDDEPSVATTTAAPGGTTDGDLNGEPVDVCAILTREKAEEIVGGPVNDPTSAEPSQSLLGDCNYMVEAEATSISASARPADEYEATVGFIDDIEEVQVAGAASASYSPSVGLLVLPEGEDYMLQIIYFVDLAIAGKAESVAAGDVILG